MGCIPWADGSIIPPLPLQRETTPLAGSVVSQERRRVGDALPKLYTTHKPEGSLSVAAGDIVNRASLPDLEKPVLWWRHREDETNPSRGRW